MVKKTSLISKQKKPLRLILLTQWFDPEPTFKGQLFASSLVEKGFNVEVITGFPNYPGGKLYEGYRIRFIQRELNGGVNVTRLPLYPSHDKSKIGRILNYLSFSITTFIYLTFFAKRADVIYVYHPPITVGFAAVIAKFFRRTPTVLDIQDMWPDTLRATGMLNNARALKIIDRVCRFIYRRVDSIVVLSPGFKKLLLERNVPEKKLNVIYNWADETAVSNKTHDRPDSMKNTDTFRVLFAGNMGPAQALDTVLVAAKILHKTNPNVEFCFLGAGLSLEGLKERAKHENLSNIQFFPRVPMAEVGQYLAAADCLLVNLRADPLFSITVPSKTQAYLAAGKPIIMAVEGDAAELIHKSNSGIVVPPENPEKLANSIIELANMPSKALEDMGANAERFYTENLSLNKGTDAFVDLFHKLARTK